MDPQKAIHSYEIQEKKPSFSHTPVQANRLKACSFNLILYTQNSSRIEEFKDYIRRVTSVFPCQIIFIQSDRTSQRSYLHVHTVPDPELITYDQIIIEATGEENLRQVPFLILSHLVSDLPVYLLWGEEPTQDIFILPHLQSLATRIVFDPEIDETQLKRFSYIVLTEIETMGKKIADMNWVRIGGWRQVLAETFDSPKRMEQLTQIQQVNIRYQTTPYTGYPNHKIPAIYLQAWLAIQLGWELKRREQEGENIVFYYEFNHHLIKVNLIPDRAIQDVSPGEILEIELLGPNDYFCKLLRQKENQIIVSSCTQYECIVPFTVFLPTIYSGRNFIQEIFYQKVSDHYIAMLRLFVHPPGDKNELL